MIEQENHRELLLENISFNEIKNLNLKKVQLKETPFLNQYLYESKVIKFLNWELKPKINFLISYKDNNIILETSEELIKGLGVFSEIIKVKIKFNIFYNQEDSCKVQRSIIFGLKKKPKFLKVIPDKIFKKLFSQSLELIAKRSDKRLLLTLSRSLLK